MDKIMPKTIRHCYFEHLTFENLLNAHNRCCRSKKKSYERLRFELDLETNIANLLQKLKDGTYNCGKYREFILYESKKRVIKSLPYVDRVVHQWYIEEFIKPYIVPRFIHDTYACIEDRGTHKAVDTVQRYMRIMKRNCGEYYIMKMDISKYFYSIDKDILYGIMQKIIKDKYLLWLTRIFIYDNDDKKGIPIGNYTSQYYANIYLNELDHFVKDKLKCRFYVRYMDDFILLVKDKETARKNFKVIQDFLHEHLQLELNNKSRYFPNYKGLDFCGFKIYETHKLLRRKCKVRIRRKVKKWNKMYLENKLDLHQTLLCYNSYLAHSSHCSSYNFNKKLEDSMLFKL